MNLNQVLGTPVIAATGGVQLVGVADGAGNKVTSNSTATSTKIALDQNILSILGTAPTTAGFLDVKGADGNVFVRQATAANLNATVVQSTAANLNATVVQSGTWTVAQGTAAAVTAPWPTKPGAPTTSSYTLAAVSFSSSGDNVLVSGVVSQTIRVFRIFVVNSDATTASNLTIKDATPTNLSGAFRLASGGSFSGDGGGDPLFVCASGKAFEINSSAAVQVSGTVWYTQS
jgi:hypothetical protein